MWRWTPPRFEPVRFLREVETYASLVRAWQQRFPRKQLPNYFLLHIRILGASQRGTNKVKLAPCKWKLTSPCGKPPQESYDEISTSRILASIQARTSCYIDGALGWKKAGKDWPRKRLKWVVVKHSHAEFARKRRQGRTAGTQQLDRQWHHVKKSVPHQWTTTSKGRSERKLSGSILAWTVASSERRPCVRQPRQVMQTKPTRKIEKKSKKKAWSEPHMQIHWKNSEFEGKTPFEARVSEFLRKLTIELHMLYARNLGFLHISSKNPVDADIANRKHYSAPAGRCDHVFPCPGQDLGQTWQARLRDEQVCSE